jgi:glycosyltransferase involved in cell wall biosynthesis
MKSHLRIALIAASPNLIGGHSVQAQGLVTEFCASGYDVSYIPIDVRFPNGLRWVRRWRYLRTLLNEVLYIFSLYRIVRVDLVHVFSASYWSFLLGPAPAILVAKLLRKPVILHYHSGEAEDHLEHWRMSVRALFPLVDEIVVPSLYLRQIFESHGYRARVIPNSIETARFQYRERALPRPHLLSARNLERHYRVDTIIKAFALLKRQFPDATLSMAGSGSEERTLRGLVDDLSIGGIRFLGSVEPAAMPQVYDAADIFVNASVVDNQPVSILEAFASGLPVVSTATGDIGSMLRGGEAGLLVDADDPTAIANAVTRLLDEPEASIRFARRAREEVERYTWRYVGAEWNALYAEVLSGVGEEALAHG